HFYNRGGDRRGAPNADTSGYPLSDQTIAVLLNGANVPPNLLQTPNSFGQTNPTNLDPNIGKDSGGGGSGGDGDAGNGGLIGGTLVGLNSGGNGGGSGRGGGGGSGRGGGGGSGRNGGGGQNGNNGNVATLAQNGGGGGGGGGGQGLGLSQRDI